MYPQATDISVIGEKFIILPNSIQKIIHRQVKFRIKYAEAGFVCQVITLSKPIWKFLMNYEFHNNTEPMTREKL